MLGPNRPHALLLKPVSCITQVLTWHDRQSPLNLGDQLRQKKIECYFQRPLLVEMNPLFHNPRLIAHSSWRKGQHEVRMSLPGNLLWCSCLCGVIGCDTLPLGWETGILLTNLRNDHKFETSCFPSNNNEFFFSPSKWRSTFVCQLALWPFFAAWWKWQGIGSVYFCWNKCCKSKRMPNICGVTPPFSVFYERRYLLFGVEKSLFSWKDSSESNVGRAGKPEWRGMCMISCFTPTKKAIPTKEDHNLFEGNLWCFCFSRGNCTDWLCYFDVEKLLRLISLHSLELPSFQFPIERIIPIKLLVGVYAVVLQ